jgi:hypothetical protein
VQDSITACGEIPIGTGAEGRAALAQGSFRNCKATDLYRVAGVWVICSDEIGVSLPASAEVKYIFCSVVAK